MGRISSSTGLVSGIDTKSIIDQLMALEAKGKDQIQTRIDGVNDQKVAYTDLSARATKVGAGSLTIELGGGELTNQTTLAQLNGGNGVRRGQFRITDRSGANAVIDVSNAVTVDDVISKINTSLGVTVRASVQGDKLV